MILDGIRIIAVDRVPDLARRLESLFERRNVGVYRESSLDRVLERFESEPYDVLIVTTSAFKAGEIDGIELLEVITNNSPTTQILFLVESRDIPTSREKTR